MARSERSRKTEFTILQRLASMKQAEIAAFMDVSEATVSRTVSEISKLSDFLTALGFKVVPEDVICMSEEKAQALKYFARIGVGSDESDTESQLWGEE